MTTIPSITALPSPAPSTSDPTDFDTRADALLGALPTMVTEENAAIAAMNTVSGEMNSNATAAAASASAAAGSATAAANSATSAAASATSAINAAAAMGSSTTSQSISPTSSLTFTTQSGKNWQLGQWLSFTHAADQTKWALGQVSAYAGSSLTVQFAATSTGGTIGAYADWNISLTSPPSNITSGPFTVSNSLTAEQQVIFSGVCSPTGVSGTLNDYNPTDASSRTWATAFNLQIGTSGTTALTGLAGGAAGRIAVVENTGTGLLEIVSGSASSAAANRFASLPTGQTQIVLRPGAALWLVYDAVASLWRPIGALGTAFAADIWSAVNQGAYVTPFDQAAACAFGALTDASTIAWEIATAGLNVTVTLTASGHTVGNPTLNGGALFDGCPVLLELVEDATGGRTVLWGTSWDFGSNGTPSLNTTANKRTWVSGVYRSATSKIHVNKVWLSA